ncbi:MAG: alpha-L-rhamnosidase C-terminal domain-containing protein [Acidobacteriota bacterium]
MSYLTAIFCCALAAGAPAQWIWNGTDEPAPKNRFTYFRKVIDLPAKPAGGTLLFAADSNARLWVNGRLLRRKVSRFHEDRITAETVDAGPALRAGRNVIVVLHHNWGPITTFQRSANRHAGLYIAGAWLRTDASWRVLRAPEFAVHDEQILGMNPPGVARIRYPVVVDGGKMLDVHAPDFDDSAWARAAVVTDGPWGAAPPAPVEIPPQREYAVAAPSVLASGTLERAQPLSDDPLSIARGIRTAKCHPQPRAPRLPVTFTGAAGESRYITFDLERPVHGYPFLEIASAPAGVKLDLGYGEVAYPQRSGARPVTPDGWIDPEAVAGAGYADRYITRSGAQRIELPDERTARWLTVHIHFPAAGSVTLTSAGLVSSQYPATRAGSFSCGDARIDQIVNLCLIHAEVTMVDGFVDTPGREDGLWIEDARVRGLIAARWYGDERLRQFVLRLHAESARPDGTFHPFPPSNYPAGAAPYDWAVQWTAMLYDDYIWTGETVRIAKYWDALRRFWDNALAHTDDNGIWRADAVLADINVGARVASPRESSGVVTPFLIERLRWSAEMAEASGHADDAARWRSAADRMAAAFRKFHLVAAAGAAPLHADDRLAPEDPAAPRGFSQAAQVNAALAGLIEPAEARAALDYAFAAPDGAPPAGVARWNNPTFSYRSLRALTESGLAERAVAHFIDRYAPYLPGNPRNRAARELQGPWGGPLPEYWISREDLALKDGEPNPAQPVDETGSHGWGAAPLLWLHDTLLGVRILTSGGTRLRIAPQSAGLPYVAGHTLTPKGAVWVHWDPARRRLETSIPPGVEAELVLPDAALRIAHAPARPAPEAIAEGGYRLTAPGVYVFEGE